MYLAYVPRYMYFIRGFGQRVRCVWRNKKLTPKSEDVKPGLHLNANDICGREARQNVWYIRTLSALAEAANRPYINILYA